MSDERDELSDLIDDARAELDARVDPGARERVLQRLEAASGGGPAGGAPPPSGSPPAAPGLSAAGVATHAALALVTGVIGYFVHAWTHPITTRVETRERVVEVPVERVVEVVRTVPAAVTDAAVAAPARHPVVEDQLGAEQWLIDQASAALREGRPDAAVAATEEHRRRFPRGQLRAMREVLRAEGLAASGRTEEARSVALAAMRAVGEGPLRARLRALTGEGDAR